MTRHAVTGRKVVTRTGTVVVLRTMVASSCRNPAHFALHSGRTGEATQLAAQGCQNCRPSAWVDGGSERLWSMYGKWGEGAEMVSAALARR